MLFSSIIFLYLFLPIVLVIYLTIFLPVQAKGPGPRGITLANASILLISLTLYTWSESLLVAVVLASTTVDYACGLSLGPRGPGEARTARDRWVLGVSIASNLGLLGLFKYLGFGVETAVAILEGLGASPAFTQGTLQIALPLGISFYSFQSMSYTIDVYRGRVAPAHSFIDFACYVTMFPQLVAGPIVRYRDVERALRARRISCALFASGVQRLVFGLGKKVLIANTLAIPADQIFAAERLGNMPTPGVAWFGLACYTLQIYFDFSGYSDMAIGLGRMLGFRFQENFRYPYAAQSVTAFWRRWHISLSSWFRDYLYIPLGGNRGSAGRTYRNLAIVFLLCGLWHGASWTFVVWGAMHGALLVMERAGFGTILKRAWRPLRHVYTLLAVMLTWVVFRCESLAHALAYLQSLVGRPGAVGWQRDLRVFLEADVLLALVTAVVLSAPVARHAMRWRVSSSTSPGIRVAWSLSSVGFFALVLFIAGMQLAAATHQPFIYFRF